MLTALRRRIRPEANARRIREERQMLLPGTDVVFLFQRDGVIITADRRVPLVVAFLIRFAGIGDPLLPTKKRPPSLQL